MSDNIAITVNEQPINVTQSVTESPVNVAITATHAPTSVSIDIDESPLSVAITAMDSPVAVSVQAVQGIEDAPIDGTTYGRKDGDWEAVTAGGGGGTWGSITGILSNQTDLQAALDAKLSTETDPVFNASPAAGIDAGDIANWDGKAGKAEANTFTEPQTIAVPTATQTGLTIQTTDNDETNPALKLKNAAGTAIASLEADGILKLNAGNSLPAFDVGAPDFAIKIVRVSGASTSTGLYFQNKEDSGYAEFTLLNDIETIFAMGIGGDGEVTGYDNVGYIYINSSGKFITLDATTSGQYIQFQTAAGVTVRITENGLFIDVIKSGATQAGAGAAAGEIWKTNGHATLPNNVLMIGV